MLRIVQSQRNRALLAMSSRIQASRGTVLFSTNAAEVFDDEANRQQLEQVSQQMEDAMYKEKQISSQMHQASNNVSQTWDTGSQAVNDPSDERIPQSKVPEMNAIQSEVRDQTRQRVGDDLSKEEKTSPMGFQTDGPSRTRYYNDSSSNDDAWKQRDMPPGRNYNQNTTTSGGFMQDTAKVTMDGFKDMVDGVMKPSTDSPGKADEQLKRQQQQREWQESGGSGATLAGEETQQTSRWKQYSEHRQNASLS